MTSIERISAMDRAAVAAAINACHPAAQTAPVGSPELKQCLEADALAMELITGRHEKREIVDLIRWLLMGAPEP